MNMTQASPRPWSYAPTTINGNMRSYKQGWAIVQTGTANLIAGCFSDVIGGDDAAKANAAIIVKCVNNHDALVAALEAMTTAFGPAGGDCGESLEDQKQQIAAHAAARKLLEQLKG